MRSALLLVLLLGFAPVGLTPAPAHADEPPPAWQRDLQDGAERLRQGLDKALDEALGSLDAWARALPQYEMPRLNENGDIIIRRKRPGASDHGQGTSI